MAPNCHFCLAFSEISGWDLNLSSSRNPRFSDIYVMKKKLGKGRYGTVRECVRKKDGARFAVKVIEKSILNYKDEEAVKQEIAILEFLDHPHVMRLYKNFEEGNYYRLVTELIQGGELFDRIVKKTTYSEKETRDVCKPLFEAMNYCHQNSVAHRDLKPENLMLMSLDSDSEIKIVDFGLAKRITKPNSLLTKCGTLEYAAPEVLASTGYDRKCDMWSLGCIIYILLSGYPPFSDKKTSRLFNKIRNAKYDFDETYWANISDDAKDLVSKLLEVNPTKRISAEEALQHRWVRESDYCLSQRNLNENLVKLKKFNASRKFRAATKAVIMANTLMSEKILENEASTYESDEEGDI